MPPWSFLWWTHWGSQNAHHFPDNIFKCIFLNETVWVSLKISQKCVCKVWINNSTALLQIMAWCRPGDKLLSEPMMVSLLTHKHVTWPQWVKKLITVSYEKWCITSSHVPRMKNKIVGIWEFTTSSGDQQHRLTRCPYEFEKKKNLPSSL